MSGGESKALLDRYLSLEARRDEAEKSFSRAWWRPIERERRRFVRTHYRLAAMDARSAYLDSLPADERALFLGRSR